MKVLITGDGPTRGEVDERDAIIEESNRIYEEFDENLMEGIAIEEHYNAIPYESILEEARTIEIIERMNQPSSGIEEHVYYDVDNYPATNRQG